MKGEEGGGGVCLIFRAVVFCFVFFIPLDMKTNFIMP